MTASYLDGAAILGALEALDSRRPGHANQWAFRCVVEVTTALLVVPEIALSPIPELHRGATGPYGDVLAEFAEVVEQVSADPEQRKQALGNTRRWAIQNEDRLRGALGDLHESPCYREWLEWLMRKQWPDHIQRHGGLFEQTFRAPIAAALGMSVPDLDRAGQHAVTSDGMAEVIARPDSEVGQIVCDAFALSTLLRGRYYEGLCKKTGTHILHHPIREPILMRLPQRGTVALPYSNTAHYLSSIIVACAYNESERHRPKAWASSVKVARARIRSGELDVADKPTDAVALTVAARGAKRIGLRTHPAWIDHLINALVSVGVGALTEFQLDGFGSVGAGSATGLLLERTQAIARINRTATNREGRLERIGRLGAGRISATWRT